MVTLLAHFLLYGALGWCVEIFFTGVCSIILQRDRTAMGRTSLWMHPIYGVAGLLMESLYLALADLPLALRLFVYLCAVYIAEYTSGYLLRRLLGRCPWDYGVRRWAVHGLIRLDYAPAWLLLCVLIEPAQAWARTIFGD